MLSSEDQLRIQVMLHNAPRALRIDENQMVLHVLTAEGEGSIPLSPNQPSDKYLKTLREMLSEHVLGSAGGYPLYLKRWSRMGHTGEQHLEQFLLLAEPEAVVAVANSPALTVELAELVWWAVTNTAQQAEQGLHMLRRDCVVESGLGPEIARYLMEHLPFLSEPEDVLATLAAVLRQGLLQDEEVERIWKRSQERGKGIYQIAFLQGRALALPMAAEPNGALQQRLGSVATDQTRLLERLQQIASAEGQAFVTVAIQLLEKVANEVSVYALMNAIGGLFSDLLPIQGVQRELDQIDMSGEAGARCQQGLNGLEAEVESMLFLAHVREEVAFNRILHSGSVGRPLRNKMKPEFDLIRRHLHRLQP